MFSLPEQKASFSGDINISLALNSKQNLSWEPLHKARWAVQCAASPQSQRKCRHALQSSSAEVMAWHQAQLRTVFLQPTRNREMRKHGQSESEHPVYSWHQEIWMSHQCDWGERTGDTPHSWGFWTQGQAGSLSLDHVQYEEAGLSPYPKELLEQCSGTEGRMGSCFPFSPPKALGFPETSAISITFSLNIQLRDWNTLKIQ